MPEHEYTIIERYNEAPLIIQQILYYNKIRDFVASAADLVEFTSEQSATIENEFVYFLLNFQDKQALEKALSYNVGLSSSQISLLLDLFEIDILSQIVRAEDLDTEKGGSVSKNIDSLKIPTKAPALQPIETYAGDMASVRDTAHNAITFVAPAEPVYTPAPLTKPSLSEVPTYTPTPAPTTPTPPVAPDRPRWSSEI